MRPVIKFILLLSTIVLILSSFVFFLSFDFDPRNFHLSDNCIFYDRNGKILRFIPDKKGERHIWIEDDEIPEMVKNAFIAAEDSRFYMHPGFDATAIFRALKDNLIKDRIVSGASTITQQLVRLTYPRKRRYRDKLYELFRSIHVELSLTKKEILVYYLNRVPMGNNIVGIELASQVYFGKSSPDISISEAAVLASLPKAPTRLNPYGKNSSLLLKRKNYVLKRMAEEGFINEQEYYEAKNTPLAFQKYSFPYKAPHVIDLLITRKYNTPGEHVTTIDLACQSEVEKILISHKVRLWSRNSYQAAAMIVHNPTMEVLASVGSLSYSSQHGGFNKGQTALRSAGSTLKPFAYAEALETGFTASTVIEDTLKNYSTPSGDYIPLNYDRGQYGPVTLRVALGNSFNISAIKVIEQMRVERFYALLNQINLINFPRKGPEAYGLGLVVGNTEVNLEQLVTAYTVFANRGMYSPVKYFKKQMTEKTKLKTIFSPETAYIISHILSDPSARMITFGQNQDMDFPFKVSLKTGTSTLYRDGWIIGYTPEYTVGVWTGNFDGTPTYGLSGAEGAGPIFKDIMSFLYKKGSPSLMSPPKDIIKMKVCGISGKKPAPFCQYVTEEIFIKGTEPLTSCTFHQKDKHHHLPSSYAAWLTERNNKGIPENYRIDNSHYYGRKRFETKDNEDTQARKIQTIRIKNKKETMPQSDTFAEIGFNKPERYSIGTKAKSYQNTKTDNTITIIYPLPDDQFIFDRHLSHQAIELQAVSQKPVQYIDWYINGLHHARTGPPYYSQWRLKKGRHTIVAASNDRMGDVVEIVVE